MSRMFIVDGKSMKTWNVFVGCKFDCTYCNARKLALTRLKHIPRYKNGFEPHLVESELSKKFKPGDFIFCAYMGDLSFASYPDMVVIFNRIIDFPQTKFLLQTKNQQPVHHVCPLLSLEALAAKDILRDYKAVFDLRFLREVEANPFPLKLYLFLW